VILLTPLSTWEETAKIPIRQLSADPGFVFLWVGRGDEDGLERGRECLAGWGFRRAEDIVWVKTNKVNKEITGGKNQRGVEVEQSTGNDIVSGSRSGAAVDPEDEEMSEEHRPSQERGSTPEIPHDQENQDPDPTPRRPRPYPRNQNHGALTDGLFASSKEHCLMGIRGTVRRSTDSRFVHCNVDTDVMIWEDDGGE
jgi:hypothetical protein